MLTKRQNLLETIRGGHPDRFVNQFEAFAMLKRNPYSMNNPSPKHGEINVVNAWGVTKSWPANQPGSFPDHSPEKIVIKDITRWSRDLIAPKVIYTDKDWEPYAKEAENVDRKEQFATFFCAPGVFEQCHHLMGMQECLIAFYDEPKYMHELIDFLTDWELQYAEQVCKYLKPDAVFHHDDWGSQTSTFLSPEMFAEFYLPAYQKIYGYYKSHGVELIVHHSDSYAATLVGHMINMGVDIWQGAVSTNNLPELIRQYGGQISIMAGIDSASVDFEGWTQQEIAVKVEQACRDCGKLYFIPCQTQAGTRSSFPGVYEAISREIDQQSLLMFLSKDK